MSTKSININIVLLGNSSVGKTSLLTRYTNNEFNNNYITTCGYDFETKDIKIYGKDVHLKIHDTVGQERYQSIITSFYKKNDGFIFVFDVTNKQSFQEIQTWLKGVEENNEDFDCVLVGNKIDLKNSIEVNKEDVNNCDYLKNIKYFETSAKDNQNVQEVFEELTRMILEKFEKKGKIGRLDYMEKTGSFKIQNKKESQQENKKKSCC